MPITRRSLIAATLALAAWPARASGEVIVLEGPALGAGCRTVLPAWADAASASERITAVIGRIDRQMSPYRAESDLSRFNAGSSEGWFAIPQEFATTLDAALHLARRTGGAFDPTLGALVGRYGFGPIRGGDAGNWADVELSPHGIRARRAGLRLDLCGIAKGHALDLIMTELMQVAPGEGFLVELGGEIRAQGRHPSGRSWRGGIERAEGDGLACAVVLDGGIALATSGDRVHSYRRGGRIYSHIADGRRRAPADGSVASVSVLAGDATTADGLATALYAMGSRDGPAFADAEGIAALFQIRRDGRLVERMTGDFAARVERPA